MFFQSTAQCSSAHGLDRELKDVGEVWQQLAARYVCGVVREGQTRRAVDGATGVLSL